MSDIITQNQEYIPAPERDRRDHVPSVGDIYIHNNSWGRCIRIAGKRDYNGAKIYTVDVYSFAMNGWKKENDSVTEDNLKEYYTLLLCPFEEILAAAEAALEGDSSLVDKIMTEADHSEESLALMVSRPADQVFALAEANERMQDKLTSVSRMMNLIVESKVEQMKTQVRALDEKLSSIRDVVENIQKVITVMNLYTGQSVDVEVICDGEKAPADIPITVRQRILFMDEEFLADAENGGIDYRETSRFYNWLKKPEARDIICPEPKCIVAMKPKRYNKSYSDNWHENQAANKWNHHTIILFRDGERLFALDSEDLELYDTALPYSDQQERFEKRYKEIMSEKSFQESNLKRLNDEAQHLGYMYTKYIAFLQGVVDSGKIFDLSEGRPNFATEEGVRYVRDAENTIGTGRDWSTFQAELNSHIRRGTRIVYCHFVCDKFGMQLNTGDYNRTYWHDTNKPWKPLSGIYNVDYPSTTKHYKDEKTGRWETIVTKGDRLAFFYVPDCFYARERKEGWIYENVAVLNYDLLSIEVIDELMHDRTQRDTFRYWMPLLQTARKQLMEEKRDEDAFIELMKEDIRREKGADAVPDDAAFREAVAWWKEKVIFTRPLRSDDAKAWRMIKKHLTSLEKN